MSYTPSPVKKRQLRSSDVNSPPTKVPKRSWSPSYDFNSSSGGNLDDSFDNAFISISLADCSSQHQSQLSQIRTQTGQFSYHPNFMVNSLNDTNYHWEQLRGEETARGRNRNTSELEIVSKSFNMSLTSNNVATVTANVSLSYVNFTLPSTKNIEFLRGFIRIYRRINSANIGEHDPTSSKHLLKEVKRNYLNFWR